MQENIPRESWTQQGTVQAGTDCGNAGAAERVPKLSNTGSQAPGCILQGILLPEAQLMFFMLEEQVIFIFPSLSHTDHIKAAENHLMGDLQCTPVAQLSLP